MARDEDGGPNAGPGDPLSGCVLKERTVEVVMRTLARSPSRRRRRCRDVVQSRNVAQSRRGRREVVARRAEVRLTSGRRPT